MTFNFLMDQRESPAVTFAEPGSTDGIGDTLAKTFSNLGGSDGLDEIARVHRDVIFPAVKAAAMAPIDPLLNPKPYADIFTTAERSIRLTGNAASEGQAREEAYDRRIKAVRDAAGVDLENPERGGYAIDARKIIREEVLAGGMAPIDGKGGVPAYQRRVFDQRLAEIQKDHPDLKFGDLDTEARELAKGSADAVAKAAAADVNPIASLGFGLAGGLWGSRRDPVFVGSMFAGPASAVGRTALARVASGALRSGLFNAGLSAVEQPAVQEWRAKVGLEHGVVPALEDVGLAFALGAIPGAAIQGIKEGLATPLRRLLAGHPEIGDVDAITSGLPHMAPRDEAALRVGEESVAADRATLTEPRPADVPPQLHDDMLAAALKRADDPTEPSPEAVRMTAGIDAYHGSPYDFEAFDLSKIGTGEGAQSYGHGLYFAENPAVAENYAETLSARPRLAPKAEPKYGEKLRQIDADEQSLHPARNQILRRRSAAGDHAVDAEALRKIDDAIDAKRVEINDLLIAAHKEFPLPAEGALYKVRINADKEHFLDWDKPLREQSDYVKAALRNAGWDPDAYTLPDGSLAPQMGGPKGVDVILQGKMKSNPEATSQALREAGIPGIKYLDQGSRDAGDGSRNFVVFDDKAVEITHKNEKPVNTAIRAEVEQRIKEADPKSLADAHIAADEALDDIGNRLGVTALREQQDGARAALDAARVARQAAEPVKTSRGDPMGKMPWVGDDGKPTLLTAKAAAALGERDSTFAALVRSCK